MTTDDELIEAMLVAMYDDGRPGVVDSMRAVLAVVREHDGRDAERPCTCHPDDNPPRPCPKQYALHECKAAIAEAKRRG